MKYLYLITLLILTNFNKKNLYQSISNTQDFDKKRCGDVLTRHCEKVYADVSINAISLKKIIATVTIVNDSSEAISLYKPLLPQGNVSGNLFSITDLSKYYLLLPKGEKPFIYRPDNEETGLASYLLPNITDSNLVELKPFTKRVFQMNLSDTYDFSYYSKKKIDSFMIAYFVSMPYI